MSQINRRSSRMINQRNRRGITIVEILIAITISLTVLLALAVAFREMSKEISNGRSVMELATKLRNATETIRNDFENRTVTTRHWTDNSPQLGYIELGEGPARENDLTNTPPGDPFDMQGDVDDYFALTVRSEGKPFRGRFEGLIIESPVAEVIYWTQVLNSATPIPNNATKVNYANGESLVLYRRVLLVRPDLDLSGLAYADLDAYYNINDVSARGTAGNFVPNSLEDLTLFENRFAHTFDDGVTLAELHRPTLANRVLSGTNLGEDVLLTDLIGFDLRVYSPDALVVDYSPAPANAYDNNQYVVEPNDIGYTALAASYPAVGQGAFVDMGFAGGPSTIQFAGIPQSLNLNLAGNRVWTNWTMHYEKDGIDQNSIYGADEATNGIDDDGVNGVDDAGERETLPPYPYPLRGLQVSIRLIDVKTKQIRQSTLTQSFLPE